MGPSGRIEYILHILDCLGQENAGFIQVLYLGRAPRTKETRLDFREKCRVTRHSRVFRGLTSSHRTLLKITELPTNFLVGKQYIFGR